MPLRGRRSNTARSPVPRLDFRPGPGCMTLWHARTAFAGGPPFFARGRERFQPHRRGAFFGSRRTSSVGRGCEALPLRPRWEMRGDSLNGKKCCFEAGDDVGPRRWPAKNGRSLVEAPPFTWLILPVVICLSQRLSHASVSTCRQMAKPRTAH